MFEIEKKIVIFLNRPRAKALDFSSELISNIHFLIFFWVSIIAVAMFFDFKTGLDIFNKLIVVFVLHYIVSELIIKYGAKKLSIKRLRPYVAHPDEIRGLGHNFSDSSFPSSHVSSVVGGLIVLYAAYPMLWPALVVFALLLALSRLHNGMHYPTDVLAGFALGYVYGHVVLFFM